MTAIESALSVEPERIDDVTRQIKLTIPGDAVIEQKTKKLRHLQKTARVDGFRKGKTTLSVVDRMYGQNALVEAIESLCWSTWQKAVDQGNLKPIGQPDFSIPEFKTGESVDFSVNYQVMPEIILGDYSSIRISKEEASVSDEDLDATIANILENHTRWDRVDRPSRKGDTLIVDLKYSVFLNEDSEEKVAEHERASEKLVLSDDFAIPELLPHLIGLRAGDQLDREVSLPQSFHNTQWRGKKSKFIIGVKSVEEPNKPELDADFARKMGVAEDKADPVAAFRQEVLKNINFELQSTIKDKFRNKLLQEVVNKTNIPVPAAMEDYCNKMLRREMVSRYVSPEQLKQRGNDAPEDMLPPEGFAEQAKTKAAISILIAEIEHQRDMSVTEDEIRAVAKGLAVQYDEPERFINSILEDQTSAENCKSRAIEDKIIRWLESQVQVNLISKTYSEVMDAEDQNDNPAESGTATQGVKT